MVSDRVNVFEYGDEDWWAECLGCPWVSSSNVSQRRAEEKFGRHWQNEHLSSEA